MATMEIINDLCECGARATRTIRDKTGSVIKITCTRHATAALLTANLAEIKREQATIEELERATIKAVKS